MKLLCNRNMLKMNYVIVIVHKISTKKTEWRLVCAISSLKQKIMERLTSAILMVQ